MSMEARLLILAVWCGVYALVIRFFLRGNDWTARPWAVMTLNALFWATFMAMAGMLYASYADHMDDTMRFAIRFAVVGLGIGVVFGYLASRREEKRDALIRDNLEWADTGFYAILLASVVMYFFVQAFKIPSGSMRMTFVEGDHLFVNKFVYGMRVPLTGRKVLSWREVKAGDIVIFRFPTDDRRNEHHGKDFIKRVVATEGQEVALRNKVLTVDGVRQEETYVQHVDATSYPPLRDVDPALFQQLWESGMLAQGGGNAVRDNFGPVVVPEGTVLALGDNRDRSFDGRYFGPLPVSDIKGRALLVYWPLFPKNRFRIVR